MEIHSVLGISKKISLYQSDSFLITTRWPQYPKMFLANRPPNSYKNVVWGYFIAQGIPRHESRLKH